MIIPIMISHATTTATITLITIEIIVDLLLLSSSKPAKRLIKITLHLQVLPKWIVHPMHLILLDSIQII